MFSHFEQTTIKKKTSHFPFKWKLLFVRTLGVSRLIALPIPIFHFELMDRVENTDQMKTAIIFSIFRSVFLRFYFDDQFLKFLDYWKFIFAAFDRNDWCDRWDVNPCYFGRTRARKYTFFSIWFLFIFDFFSNFILRSFLCDTTILYRYFHVIFFSRLDWCHSLSCVCICFSLPWSVGKSRNQMKKSNDKMNPFHRWNRQWFSMSQWEKCSFLSSRNKNGRKTLCFVVKGSKIHWTFNHQIQWVGDFSWFSVVSIKYICKRWQEQNIKRKKNLSSLLISYFYRKLYSCEVILSLVQQKVIVARQAKAIENKDDEDDGTRNDGYYWFAIGWIEWISTQT